MTTHTHPKRRLMILLSVPFAFSLVFFAVTSLTQHTDVGLANIQALSSSIVRLRLLVAEVEASERGFLLTGEDRYLASFKRVNSSLQSQIDACFHQSTSRSANLRNDVSHLGALVQQRTLLARTAIEAKQSSGGDSAIAIAKIDAPEQSMDEIRVTVDRLQKQLNDEESNYLRRQFRLNYLAFLCFVLGTLVVVAVMLWLYRTSLSYLAARDALELQLKDLNANLEGQVNERTRDLQLANEELQQFAYVASHDLQEPLRTVTSFSQLLESRYKGKLDEDADEFIDYIVTSARRMTDLINGLLALARLRKTGLPTTPVSFNDLLAETQDGLRTAISDSKAQIVHDALPSLAVDRVQFLQVLQNLILNSIKYRREEPPRIRVSAWRTAGTWVFAFGDNGRGFDPQFADRIFGLFQRLHGREVAEGTGMGLSIARKIVERHGGRMWAESQEGTGSTFFFSLPVSLEVSRPSEATQSVKAFAQMQ
ncbi:MAG: CHASE3 domain-containing protein [Acidobacteriaceae bacterium]|nr:CHASE3 domain-containing protein [Acidobacteriaceae bacterium]